MTAPSIYDAADLYDAQYERYRDDVPHYLRLADDAGGRVLELGAGTGRLTAALARAGHEVVAVELSAAMLERARARLGAEGLAGRVRLLEGDMRALGDLPLGGEFALVLAPFNTLMHLYTLSDQDAALAGVEAHLESGGVFAFDLFTPRFGPLGVLRREAEWAGVGGAGSELFLLQEHDPDRQLITSRYYLDTVDARGALTRRTAVLHQRYYHRYELERALAQAGLRQLRLFGGFDNSPFHGGAGHLVGLARR